MDSPKIQIMKPIAFDYPLHFSSLILFASIVSQTDSTFAQVSNIVPDNTLGDESSQVIENFNDQPIEVITGGAQREQNLFHSFQEFNVSEGRGAYFNSPDVNIQNIFSRVTGRNPSDIMGVLGTFGESNPNLYLINPNGILFGENASLDVGGSFAATTASGVEFGEQGNFDTINPQIPQLLTINPSAYLFNQINQTATIQSQSFSPAGQNIQGLDAFGLRVPDNQNLLFLGGDVILDGSWLNAFGGKVELGGLKESGRVVINIDGSLEFPENVVRGDISLLNFSRILTTNEQGGAVNLTGRNISITGDSSIFSFTLGSKIGGDLKIDGTESIDITGNGFPSLGGLFVSAFSNGKSGNIELLTKNLTVQNGILVSTIANEQGQAGNISINAESVQLLGQEAGKISSEVLSGGALSAGTGGSGDAGKINITAKELILKDKIAISADSINEGNAGTIDISVDQLSIQTGSSISSSTFGIGDAGDINIKAKNIEVNGVSEDNLTNTNSQITTQTGGFLLPDLDSSVSANEGNAGNINIETNRLIVSNGGRIISSTLNAGSAGSLTIKATDSIELIGSGLVQGNLKSSGLSSDIREQGIQIGSGNGGDIIVETGRLIIKDGAQIGVGNITSTIGEPGNLIITALDSVEIIGESPDGSESGLFSSTNGSSQGGGYKSKCKKIRYQK